MRTFTLTFPKVTNAVKGVSFHAEMQEEIKILQSLRTRAKHTSASEERICVPDHTGAVLSQRGSKRYSTWFCLTRSARAPSYLFPFLTAVLVRAHSWFDFGKHP